MKILHPDKEEYYSLKELKSYYSDGFYSIISKHEKGKLDHFLHAFQNYREETNTKITDTDYYKNLPFSMHTNAWKERQRDVKIIDNLISDKKELEILDVGSWNGWLCNYLTKKGHHLTGTGLFTDEYDGLKCKKHYNTEYTLLQIQMHQLFRIKKKFDVIIFNRNWAFNTDAEAVLNTAKKMLTKTGIIICTGLAFYKNTSVIKEQFKAKNKTFQERYHIPLFYNNDAKGFLDFEDKNMLHKKELQLQLLPYNRLKNKLKFFSPKKPLLFYGVYVSKNKQ